VVSFPWDQEPLLLAVEEASTSQWAAEQAALADHCKVSQVAVLLTLEALLALEVARALPQLVELS
jgi:hypothetical protein